MLPYFNYRQEANEWLEKNEWKIALKYFYTAKIYQCCTKKRPKGRQSEKKSIKYMIKLKSKSKS